MLEFSFTEQHKALLTDYLSSTEQALPYAVCEGYLFAIICSPAGIEMEQWLTIVSGGDEQIAEEHVFALMALHHDISERVFSGQFQLPYTSMAVAELQQWSQGFLAGIEHFYAGLVNSEVLNDELKQALISSTEQLGFFSLDQSQIAAYCDANNVELNSFCQQQHEIANEFAVAYVQLVENAAVESGLYEEEG
ncbi:UPF0149 family protein [Pseudoalteromonas phenolica]|uniref:YecA family protein n=1 Tax=Pseudoalteromonas phenolica TaxID=161398 RepID=A0A0S2K604_9GAMM|nr:UPF0149 family protein [Pseudoalteromonas phenolica]ALO43576.1 YecA family protein [Pseudoalteromonas phenolica]MBE0355259.1 hypothetical protein [Pseudoalteromonas phenolica O-BC30]RXE95250.1 YecA family protein [Pseudoalteromonas phenolica O-BC30]|tara:strand:- start:164 stop:742 length:579 start_codon:yes stop_codon:yes gene_type:complete